ncbi:hypothetical protein ACFQPA_10520 [Halomarina halobia]|uniref:Glycine zipper domain-containing protein n=1 Tax=Halomarina halobia TaxID=3033386 RepID=A0ABD6AAP7_9EURY|nr:hypothetical protein [Halomarina sp. PSR21]
MSDSLTEGLDYEQLIDDVDFEDALAGTKWEGVVADADGVGATLGARIGELLGALVGAALGRIVGESLLDEMLGASDSNGTTDANGDDTSDAGDDDD